MTSNNIKSVCIIGLGYVGLPLAALCASKGYEVNGVDINEKLISDLKAGSLSISDEWLEEIFPSVKDKLNLTTDPEVISRSDIVFICVPTPVDSDHHPDLKPVKSASEIIAKYMKQGQIIVLESTVFPGTTEEVVIPILESSGKKVGTDFTVAFCPERIDPGNKTWNVSNLHRVIGAVPKASTETVAEFYRSIISGDILSLSSIKAAEAVKILENTFRDINIAFINEMAMSFDKLGIDILEVIRGASTKPFAFMPHYPGCGVGGHCIPVDPYYLIERAKSAGFSHNFLQLAREINNNMPNYAVSRTEELLKTVGKSLSDSKVTVLGVSYKGGVGDDRESPSYEIIARLKDLGVEPVIFDPYIPEKSTVPNIDSALKADAVIIATDHPEFKKISPAALSASGVKVVLDGKNIFCSEAVAKAGIVYSGIGKS